MSRAVLVVNSGSSSLKFALVEPETGRRFAEGLAERLGTAEATFRLEYGGNMERADLSGGAHQAAIATLLEFLSAHGQKDNLFAVGHRVVHGGESFQGPTVVDDRMLQELARVAPLAPLHNPVNLVGIELLQKALGDVPHVAVFDTAFHHSMPEVAYRYAVPERFYREYGVRKYGFHGTSHRFVAGRAAEFLGRPATELCLLTAHLGNGASAAAIAFGKSVDTTMGMTPLAGLVMGTRSGDLDPGAVLFLLEKMGGDLRTLDHALNHQSGLLGLSGFSNDVRVLLEAEQSGDERARLALCVFCYRAAAQLAALSVALPRVDALVFTGGIGENAAPIRARIVARLGVLGLQVDEAKNAAHPRGTEGNISPPGPKSVLVIPTDEELMIARLTIERLSVSTHSSL
jgi:acetate kinase